MPSDDTMSRAISFRSGSDEVPRGIELRGTEVSPDMRPGMEVTFKVRGKIRSLHDDNTAFVHILEIGPKVSVPNSEPPAPTTIIVNGERVSPVV